MAIGARQASNSPRCWRTRTRRCAPPAKTSKSSFSPATKTRHKQHNIRNIRNIRQRLKHNTVLCLSLWLMLPVHCPLVCFAHGMHGIQQNSLD